MTNGEAQRLNHQLMIRPFSSADEMVWYHVMLYGSLGQIAAEAVLRWAPLWPGINPLDFRIVLAPIELGPYGKHIGYTVTRRPANAPRYIIGNRNICKWEHDGSIVLACDHQHMIDFLVHEITHHRQADVLHGARQTRGAHRDRGWYGAIAEAAPAYLGVEFPTECWPKQKAQDGRLTEVEAYHWPHSFRKLIASHDPRLVQVSRTEDRRGGKLRVSYAPEMVEAQPGGNIP
jgi:hypothetical protein